MTKKHKKKEDENELYMVEVDDWEISYDFLVSNKYLKRLSRGDYSESTRLTLLGKIVWPALKNASRAKIDITGDPKLDDHWRQEEGANPPVYNGRMFIQKEDNALWMMCSVPFRSIPHLTTAAAAGKIKHVSVRGTKLKWNEGMICGIDLATQPEK